GGCSAVWGAARRERGRGANRWATASGHAPADRHRAAEAALRARTRKVAWKASSASWASPRTRRQTLSTIGPCRLVSSSKASSSRAAAKRSISWASDPTGVSGGAVSRRKLRNSFWRRLLVMLHSRKGVPDHVTQGGTARLCKPLHRQSWLCVAFWSAARSAALELSRGGDQQVPRKAAKAATRTALQHSQNARPPCWVETPAPAGGRTRSCSPRDSGSGTGLCQAGASCVRREQT